MNGREECGTGAHHYRGQKALHAYLQIPLPTTHCLIAFDRCRRHSGLPRSRRASRAPHLCEARKRLPEFLEVAGLRRSPTWPAIFAAPESFPDLTTEHFARRHGPGEETQFRAPESGLNE